MSRFIFAIKWILPEHGTENALSVLDELERFLVPDPFLIESDRILAMNVRKRELEPIDAVAL